MEYTIKPTDREKEKAYWAGQDARKTQEMQNEKMYWAKLDARRI
jgi:hypothetical protein